MPKIVILGGSFGGLTAAFELKRFFGKETEITVVSDDGKFVFLPSLPWLIIGHRRPDDITLKVSEILKPEGIDFINEAAIKIEPDTSKVFTAAKEIPYDYLIISTGPYLSFDEIPGLGPDKGCIDCAFTLDHAVKTNLAWKKILEEPGPIILGSAQGVSCFGPSYELVFEMDAELRKRKIRHKVPIFYLTSEPYVGHFGIGGAWQFKEIHRG
jgi:sulfide:quinone oxidoreductase